ncbi:MAG: HU family DNA-binding protein [Bacteroidaceae bacterium]|nr:HU family DNA-binding protein [Bacteroidaceae bacterium]
MGIAVKVSKRTLNFSDTKTEMYVASADRGDVITTKKLSEYVAQNTGSRPAQVRMILSSVIDSMVGWMEEGHGVNLEGFGTFLPAVKSRSSVNKEEVGVRRIRISFSPCKELSAKARGIKYSIADEDVASVSGGTTGSDDTTSDSGDSGSGTGGNPL